VPSSYDSGEVSIHVPSPARAGLAALGVDHAANALTRSKSPWDTLLAPAALPQASNVAKTAVAGSVARCIMEFETRSTFQAERWGRRAGKLGQ